MACERADGEAIFFEKQAEVALSGMNCQSERRMDA
jgi:hypothetical protein